MRAVLGGSLNRRLPAALALAAALIATLMPTGSAAATTLPAVASISPAAGPVHGGTAVTIQGTGFSGVTSVLIGGAAARDVHVTSPQVLTAVVPAHAVGSVSVAVRTAAGTSAPSAARYHYVGLPSISAMSARSGPVTGAQDVTITGRGLSWTRAVYFGSVPGTVVAQVSDTTLRVRTPARWAGAVRVKVVTAGGTTDASPAGVFVFRNPAPHSASELAPSGGSAVADGSDITAVSGGQAAPGPTGSGQAPWVVTLAATAAVPAVGQGFVLRPGSPVFPSGLAGTVQSVDTAQGPAVLTVAPSAQSLASVLTTAQAEFTGPLGDPATTGTGRLTPYTTVITGADTAHVTPYATAPTGTEASPAPVAAPSGARPVARSAPALTSTVDFGSISASALDCGNSDGVSVRVTGSVGLRLEHVQAHVEVRAGSLFSAPFVNVWISYQPTVSLSVSAAGEVECSLPAAWQNTHKKLFVLGSTGATIAIAPDASFTVSAGGTVAFQQHSYRMLGFISNPDGTLRRLDGKSSDPARATVSAKLEVKAYGGVQIQVGLLDVIGVGLSIGGGVKGSAEADWPPQVCLSLTPYLQGTLYAYLNAWVKEWKLQAFRVELDLGGIRTCTGRGWHVTWQSGTHTVIALACPALGRCVAVGRTGSRGYAMRSGDGGETWSAGALAARTILYAVACADTAHCVAGGSGGTVSVSSDGGARWAEVALPYVYSPLASVVSVTCVPGGTCHALAHMTRYSGTLVYRSTDYGRTWTYRNLVSGSLWSMACVSGTACVALGPGPSIGQAPPITARTTLDGWASSAPGALPGGLRDVAAVACASRSLCYASALGLSGKILTSTDFGKSWRITDDGGLRPWALSCPSTRSCVAGGDQAVSATTNGGQTWKQTTISHFPAGDGRTVFGLACAAEGHCVAEESGPTSVIVVS